MGGGRATVQCAGSGANSRDANPPLGSTPTVIDLTIDDPPADKGKQKADIEMVDVPDQPGTTATLGDDLAEASARWPDFIGLALVRAEELPR
jgi:hypothetical protein